MFLALLTVTAGAAIGALLFADDDEDDAPAAELDPTPNPAAEPSSRDDWRREFSPQNEAEEQATQRAYSRKLTISAGSLGLALVGRIAGAVFSLASIPAILYVSVDVFRAGWRSLREERRVDVNLLLSLIILVCVAKGFLVICAVANTLAMFTIKLMSSVRSQSRGAVVDVFRAHPQTVWMRVDGVDVAVALDDLEVGDLVLVRAGETLPVDGVVVSGMAVIDEHLLTGESAPVERAQGERVFALTLALSGAIEIRVEQAGEETAAAQIGALLESTITQKTQTQLWAERLGDQAVLPVLALTAISWPFIGPLPAMAVLNSHPRHKNNITSCLGVLTWLDKACEQGVLVKDGQVWEILDEVDVIVFDKTGTLTTGELELAQLHPCEGATPTQLLTDAARAEAGQSHPIARAIQAFARTRGLHFEQLDEVELSLGYGLSADLEGATIRIGSSRFIRPFVDTLPAAILEAERKSQVQGHIFIFVAHDARLVGAIELRPTIREEAAQVVATLRQRYDKSICVISGDHEAPTAHLAERLGIDRYHAQTLPEEKAALVAQMQAEGLKVCFVGDGINDAVALEQADVSISLRGASTVATDVAQIVLISTNLAQLPTVFELAKQAKTTSRRVLAAVTLPHAVSLGAALFFGYGLFASLLVTQLGLVFGVGVALWPRLDTSEDPPELG